MNLPDGATSVDVALMPWAMTQNEPFAVEDFIKEAQKRGVHLRPASLRELYRHRLLIPFVEVTTRPVRSPAGQDAAESPFGGTRITDLRQARDNGRIRDLAALPYQSRLSFEPLKLAWPSNSPWTGVLYSPYQLLALPELEATLARQTFHKRGERIIARMPKPGRLLLERMERFRKMAIALTAVEARYLPNLDPEFIQLSNVPDVADWAEYRASFDPAQTQAWLSYPSEQITQDAEFLLLMRAHHRDPVGGDWSQLMRRAPAKSREYLKDAALTAMDDRIAAEILLRFYEDLALRGKAEPLPDLSGSMGWHPLHERLSSRTDTLDEALTDLGISPHPRVVLALEGETEVYHAPLVSRALGYSSAPELIRILKLGGVGQNLQKVAALNVAPLIGKRVPAPGAAAWTVIRPSAYLLMAVDPDKPFNTPESVGRERTKLLDEIRDVLRTQGVDSTSRSEGLATGDFRRRVTKAERFFLAGSLVLLNHGRGEAAALADVDPKAFGPEANGFSLLPVRSSAWAAASSPADLTAMRHKRLQAVADLLRVPGTHVHLVGDVTQAKLQRLVSADAAAVQVT